MTIYQKIRMTAHAFELEWQRMAIELEWQRMAIYQKIYFKVTGFWTQWLLSGDVRTQNLS